MTPFRLLLRNLLYERRANFAVFLGVALGTAVLTGALLVGDSLRGSLRSLALDLLGWVDEALVPGRFFRPAVAKELDADQVAALVLLQGSAAGPGNNPARADKVAIMGVDEHFWPQNQVPQGQSFWQAPGPDVVINQALARALQVKTGDTIILNMPKIDAIPRESLLGKRKAEDVLESLSVKVRQVLPDQGMGRFTLKPTPEPARNVWLPMRFLQEKLKLGNHANALVVGPTSFDPEERLVRLLHLDDWSLKLRTPEMRARSFIDVLDPRGIDKGKLKKIRWQGRVPDELAKEADSQGILSAEKIVDYFQKHHNYLSLESTQMILSPTAAKAAEEVAKANPLLKSWPTMVYLADSISDGTKEIPYAVVAGVEPKELATEPDQKPLEDNEIMLADWPQAPFAPKTGAAIILTFYVPDERNVLEKRSERFVCRGTFPLTGKFDDPDLTPDFPGITDKLDMASWENPPFPYNPRRVKPADENYWMRYRTTPRAYITLHAAQRLWGSRFGDLTSIRIEPGTEAMAKTVRSGLLHYLNPAEGGFIFQNVKELAEKAGTGSTDFGMYFLAFSFFLILAALLLVGLLFRLNIDRRAGEIGLLLASGWSNARVRWLLLGEGALLATLGGAAGLAGAGLYADLMLQYLRARWPGGEQLAFLHFHAEPASFLIGYAASLVASVLTIFWATRVLAKQTPRALLAGQTTPVVVGGQIGWTSITILVVSLVGSIACLAAGKFVKGQEAQAGSFFTSGGLLLTAGLVALWLWLKHTAKASSPQPTLTALGVRNAGRHLARSVLTAGLLASATFLIVAVEAFHKDTGQEFSQRDGGSGGFPLYAESAVPLYQDLNQANVRDELNISIPFDKVHIYACRMRAGDDTSCLNLYQPLRPRQLGVSADFIQRGGFAFAASLAESTEKKKNPWLLLEKPLPDGSVPVFVDATSAEYILKVGLGDVMVVPTEQGKKASLKVVGLLSDSIFQSEVVMAESNFLKLYPGQEGFQFFLIDCPENQIKAIKKALMSALADQGFVVSPTEERVAGYLAVENTYLATFQALGGLGLLLGAAGLAIVLARGVWERRGELALLRALGFRRAKLMWLLLAENVFLLVAGLGIGSLAALAAVAPHWSGGSGLWLEILMLLSMVGAVGLAAGLAAAVGTLRAPVLTALRRE